MEANNNGFMAEDTSVEPKAKTPRKSKSVDKKGRGRASITDEQIKIYFVKGSPQRKSIYTKNPFFKKAFTFELKDSTITLTHSKVGKKLKALGTGYFKFNINLPNVKPGTYKIEDGVIKVEMLQRGDVNFVMPKVRQDGFYFVKFKDRDWQIGEYHAKNDNWSVTSATASMIQTAEFEEVDERRVTRKAPKK